MLSAVSPITAWVRRLAGVTLGAAIVEKHFIARRSDGGPDSAFSMEPEEFSAMVERFETRRLLWVVSPMVLVSRRRPTSSFVALVLPLRISSRERRSPENVRVIRPGNGLAPKHIDALMGQRALGRIERGTPLSWDLMGAARD